MASFRSQLLFSSIVLLTAALALPQPLQEQSRTPLPKFSGQTVTVAGVPDVYAPVRETIDQVQRDSKQRYFVVVVKNSGAGNWATRDYCFELDRVWREEAKQSGRPYRTDQSNQSNQTDRTILIVLSMSNRQLSVLASKPLQQEYGLQGESIDRELIAPHFIPFAKNHDYANGLTVLISEIEARLEAHDTARQRKAEELRARAQQLGEDATRRLKSLDMAIAREKQAGVDTTPMEGRAKTLRQQVAEATARQQNAPDRAIQLFDSINRQVVVQQQKVQQAQQRHEDALARRQFFTHTLPRFAAVTLAVLAAVVLAAFWWSSRWHRGKAKTELEAYKEQVVQLSDRLDALQERHRMLPHMDQDYTEPIHGETLRVYDGVQEAIQKFRDQWLGLMDTWENAETLIEDQGILGKGRSRKARELLHKINAPGVLAAMEAACAAPLDQLENAHELGRQLHDRVQTQRDEVQQQLTAIATDQFGITALQQAVTTLDVNSTQAQQLLVSDPLSAQQLLEETADQLGQLQQQVEEARDQIERLASASGQLSSVQERVAQERAKEMLLQEPDGTPDPMLEQAAQRQTLSRQALARGETDEATTQLDRMVTLIEAAQAIVDEQLAAREFCQQRLRPSESETETLRQRLTDARRAHATLQHDFAASAWTDVGENPSRAAELVGRADQNQHEAMGLCAAEVQHYFGAANLLRSAEEDRRAAAEMIESLAARLAELEALRTSCQEQMKRATARAYQVDQYFATHTADRPASNQRFRTAVELLEQLRAEADASQPDWAALSDQLQMAEAELDKAHEMAQRDVQLHQQAQTELAAADRAIRQARSYYHQGITADVAPARSQYEQAKQLLATQQYEQAIANAAAAQRSARRGYDDAVRTGRRRQQQIDRERRWAQAQRPSPTQRPGTFPRVPIPMPNFGGRRPSISQPSISPSRSASQSHWSGPGGGSSSASSGASQSSW